MKTFDKTSLQVLRQDINAVLADVEAKHGIKLDIGTITFNANSFRAKLEGKTVSEGGKVFDPAREDLKRYASLYLGNDVDLDATFKDYSLGEFKLVGFKSRNRKYPWLVKKLKDGKTYKVPTDLVKRAVNG